jgi:hypothetical protein
MTSPYHSARCVKLFRDITSATRHNPSFLLW